MNKYTGSFDITLTPCKSDAVEAGRMIIEKHYKGDLEGLGRGQMLSSRSHTEGSAGYVAIETFEGSLNGKMGTFTLLHKGVMDRGDKTLKITIVPDSGSGELTGISGSMTIDIAEDVHYYDLMVEL